MSMKKYVSNRSGFTLVELLIVVAIIGVLASQGVPAYRRMVQKSRKGEAQTMLGNIATAESSFFSEYGQYTNNIARAGAQTQGSAFNYAGGFPTTAACVAAAGNAIVPVFGNAVGQVPNLPGNWNTGIQGPVNNAILVTSMVGNTGGYVPVGRATRTNCVTAAFNAPAVFNPVGVTVGAIPAYVASATGNLRTPSDPACTIAGTGPNPCDAWYIDQNRQIINVIDGVSN